MSREIVVRCQYCGAPLQQARKGRTRRYCSDTCRKAAYRSRQQSWNWLDSDPEFASLPTLEDMYESEHRGRPSRAPSPDHSTVDDVTHTIVAAMAVCAEFRRHSVAAAPALAHRCEAVARALQAAIAEHFGEVLSRA